jgi:hypothetical protein
MRRSFPIVAAVIIAACGESAGPGRGPHAVAIVFKESPGPAIAGEPLSPVVVELQDDSGHVVTADTSAVTITLGANPGSTSLKGTTTVAAVAGVATFHDLSLEKAASGYTLVASAQNLPQGPVRRSPSARRRWS